MSLYNSQTLFTSSISVVPDVLTSVGTRFYHSQKVFTSCINAVPDVFTRVGTRVYHSQKSIYKLHRRGPRCFHECRNAPLLFVKNTIHSLARTDIVYYTTVESSMMNSPPQARKFLRLQMLKYNKNNVFDRVCVSKCC